MKIHLDLESTSYGYIINETKNKQTKYINSAFLPYIEPIVHLSAVQCRAVTRTYSICDCDYNLTL